MTKTVLSFLFAAAAFAAPAAPPAEKRPSACGNDIQILCKGVDPKDHAALLGCLGANEAKLSASCMAGYKAWKSRSSQPAAGAAAPAKRLDPCEADIKKLCPAIKDRSALSKCLDQNQDKLSETCRSQRTVAKNSIAALRAACTVEYAGICKGQRGACLRQHASELSPGCKAAFEARTKIQRGSGGPGSRKP